MGKHSFHLALKRETKNGAFKGSMELFPFWWGCNRCTIPFFISAQKNSTPAGLQDTYPAALCHSPSGSFCCSQHSPPNQINIVLLSCHNRKPYLFVVFCSSLQCLPNLSHLLQCKTFGKVSFYSFSIQNYYDHGDFNKL